jgi:hypothetical protein
MRNVIILLIMLSVFCSGVLLLLNLRFEKGDLYPVYSTLRADPVGTRALYESLEQIEGLSVERNFEKPEMLSCSSSTVLFIGVTPDILQKDSTFVTAVKTLVTRKNRIVLAVAQGSDFSRMAIDTVESEIDSVPKSLLGLMCKKNSKNDTVVISSKPLFSKMNWPGNIVFCVDSSWEPIVTKGSSMLLGEKEIGKGKIILINSSFNLCNQGLRKNKITNGSNPLIPYLIGSSQTVIFDEWHTGIAHEMGISGLIRKFGFAPVIFVASGWFLLFVWGLHGKKLQMKPSNEILSCDHASQDSMKLLLSTHISNEQLIDTCKNEWRTSFPKRQIPEADGMNSIDTYNSLCKQISLRRTQS